MVGAPVPEAKLRVPPFTIKSPPIARVKEVLEVNLNSLVLVEDIVKLPLIEVIPPLRLTEPPGSLVKLTVKLPNVTEDGADVFELFSSTVLLEAKLSVP